MDTLDFEYPDYNNLAQEAEAGVKRNRKVSILEREAIRMVKEKKVSMKEIEGGGE
jgi:hypothetical protein